MPPKPRRRRRRDQAFRQDAPNQLERGNENTRDRIRTYDLPFRKGLLYPAELRGRVGWKVILSDGAARRRLIAATLDSAINYWMNEPINPVFHGMVSIRRHSAAPAAEHGGNGPLERRNSSLE